MPCHADPDPPGMWNGDRRRPPRRRIVLLGDPRRVDAFGACLHGGPGRRFDRVMLQSQTLSWPLLSEPAIWRVIIASHPSAQAVSLLLNRNIIGVQVLGGAAFLEKYLPWCLDPGCSRRACL